jgi:hypothetical protein
MNINKWCFLKGFIGAVVGTGIGLLAVNFWNSAEPAKRLNEVNIVIIFAVVFFLLFFKWGNFFIGMILTIMEGPSSAYINKGTTVSRKKDEGREDRP